MEGGAEEEPSRSKGLILEMDDWRWMNFKERWIFRIRKRRRLLELG